MRISLLVALLSAGLTAGTVRPPEPAGGSSPAEMVSRVAPAGGALATAKQERPAARHPTAKLGPFTLVGAALLPRPTSAAFPGLSSIQERTGSGAHPTRGARGPPSPLSA